MNPHSRKNSCRTSMSIPIRFYNFTVTNEKLKICLKLFTAAHGITDFVKLRELIRLISLINNSLPASSFSGGDICGATVYGNGQNPIWFPKNFSAWYCSPLLLISVPGYETDVRMLAEFRSTWGNCAYYPWESPVNGARSRASPKTVIISIFFWLFGWSTELKLYEIHHKTSK